MKPVAGKRWFYALGQSHEARCVPYISQRTVMAAWPLWAKRAYCSGRMAVQHSGFATKEPYVVEFKYPPAIQLVNMTVELVR